MSYEINAAATLTAPGPLTVNFNPTSPSTDYIFITDLSGLGQAPLRTSRDPKPQAAGSIIHPTLRAERLITVTGLVQASSLVSRTSMCRALETALEAIESADGTWVWTEASGTTYHVTVRSDIAVDFTGGQGLGPKNFVFGLVAYDPAIT